MNVKKLKQILELCNDDAVIKLYYEGLSQEISEGNSFNVKSCDATKEIVYLEFQ